MNDGLGSLLTRFADLKLELADVQDREKVIKEELAGLNDAIVLQAATHGLGQKLSLPDGRSFRISPKIDAYAADGSREGKERVIEVLQAVGLGDMVRLDYSFQTLQAYVREQWKEGNALEPDLAAVLRVVERQEVTVYGNAKVRAAK